MPLGGRADQRVRESSSYVRLSHEMRQSENRPCLLCPLAVTCFHILWQRSQYVLRDLSLVSLRTSRWCVMRMALRATHLCTLRPRMLQIEPSRRWTACCSTTAKCECHSQQQQRSHEPWCISVLTGTHKALVLLARALACYLSTTGLVSDPAQAMACSPSITGLVGSPSRASTCYLSASGLGGFLWPVLSLLQSWVGITGCFSLQ